MFKRTPTLDRPLAPALVAQCLAHMDAEQQTLAATLDAMRMLRTALINRSQQQLAAAVEQQRATATQTITVMRARRQLRDTLAVVLQVPADEVTFSALAEAAENSHRGEIRRRQKTLLEMAAEVDLLNRANAALARQAIDLLGQVLACLTGEQPADRYDQSGQMAGGPPGSIVQTSC